MDSIDAEFLLTVNPQLDKSTREIEKITSTIERMFVATTTLEDLALLERSISQVITSTDEMLELFPKIDGDYGEVGLRASEIKKDIDNLINQQSSSLESYVYQIINFFVIFERIVDRKIYIVGEKLSVFESSEKLARLESLFKTERNVLIDKTTSLVALLINSEVGNTSQYEDSDLNIEH
jgi:DNA replication protein DnaD